MNVFSKLTNSQTVQILAAVSAAIGLIASLVAGVGFFASLLLAALIGISIFFGSIWEIAGSALLAVLLKITGGTAKQFIAIFTASPNVEEFFNVVDSTDHAMLIATIFLFAHLISFSTSRIKLFNISNKVSNNFK